MTEDRTRDGRAFLRISALTKFIEDDQRTAVHFFQDADDVRYVTTERRKRLLDGLLIANIRPDRMEARQFRSTLRRDVKSALSHNHQQADCF